MPRWRQQRHIVANPSRKKTKPAGAWHHPPALTNQRGGGSGAAASTSETVPRRALRATRGVRMATGMSSERSSSGKNAKPLKPARQVERDVNKQDVSSTSKTTNQPAARRVKLTSQSVGRMTLDEKSHQSQLMPPFQVTS